jgi:hypothetical protein
MDCRASGRQARRSRTRRGVRGAGRREPGELAGRRHSSSGLAKQRRVRRTRVTAGARWRGYDSARPNSGGRKRPAIVATSSFCSGVRDDALKSRERNRPERGTEREEQVAAAAKAFNYREGLAALLRVDPASTRSAAIPVFRLCSPASVCQRETAAAYCLGTLASGKFTYLIFCRCQV